MWGYSTYTSCHEEQLREHGVAFGVAACWSSQYSSKLSPSIACPSVASHGVQGLRTSMEKVMPSTV